jgi:hypothetical protein
MRAREERIRDGTDPFDDERSLLVAVIATMERANEFDGSIVGTADDAGCRIQR